MTRQLVRRWKCPACRIEGWSIDGSVPNDHDTIHGKRCAYRRDGSHLKGAK